MFRIFIGSERFKHPFTVFVGKVNLTYEVPPAKGESALVVPPAL